MCLDDLIDFVYVLTNEIQEDGRWTMTGEPAVLVDPFSATQGGTTGFSLPMNRTHSNLVKFNVRDEDYERVLAYLRTYVERARRQADRQ